MADNEQIAWVQLPYAGIEPFVHLVDDDRTWTCGKGIFAEPVAELALTLALAGLRGLGTYAKSTTWLGESGRNLIGARVTILGGGGITARSCACCKPFDCHITVVRNRVEEMEGVDEVLAADRYVDALAGADLVVLALPLTADTEEMISLTELEMMESHAWIVNVARGKHIVTDDLVWALQNDVIGGAGLDVTHPEPLPDDHPLWTLPNCIITPHVGATLEMEEPLLSERITTNVRLFAQGQGAARRGLSRPRVLTLADSTRPRWSGCSPMRIGAELSRRSSSARATSTRWSPRPACRRRRSPRRWASSSRPGLVVDGDGGLTRDGDVFQRCPAGATPGRRPPSTTTSPTRPARCLRAFVVDGRLQSIPVPRPSGWWCSTGWPRTSSPGRRTREKMVNLILGKRYRRHRRAAAIPGRRRLPRSRRRQYWRSGGTVRP